MDRLDEYKAVFSQVHTAVEVELEDFKAMKPKLKAKKGLVILAATVCLILTCSVTAYAMNLFGLKDLILNKELNEVSESSVTEASVTESGVPEDNISLQGFSDSNEFKAVEEWAAFRASYDQDGALLAQVGNAPTPFDAKYRYYNVYTQEMADKLDEIVTKYGLALHQSMEILSSAEDLFDRAGTGDFLGMANTAYSPYIYEDGTFKFDGEAILGYGKKVDYQFMNCKKGSFTDVTLNIGDADSYSEWSYKTASGVTVSLSISPEKSLVIAAMDNSFVTINVLAGTEVGFLDEKGKITASDLEALADSFDFSAIK